MSGPRQTVVACAAALLLVAASACSSSHGSAPIASGPPPKPGVTQTTATGGDFPQVVNPSRNGSLAGVRVVATKLANLPSPIALAGRPGSNELYVAERAGVIVTLDPPAGPGLARVGTTPVLDIHDDTTTDGERGLLGLVFSPDGETLYISHTSPDGDVEVEQYQMRGDVADPSTRKVLLDVPHPLNNHNGGDLVLGPDGKLWIGIGDGGSEDDPHDTAQNPHSLFGKMLIVDPANPDHPEMYALGLRNPWRFSFDRSTGDLWIGDVGQDTTEEIDELPAGTPAGTNFGWSGYEGTQVFRKDRVPAKSVPPVFEMEHSDGWCAVTGGVVYRGHAIPTLDGAYLFGDYCKQGVFALRLKGGVVTDERELGAAVPQLVSIDQDDQGEVYLISLVGAVYRLDRA